MAIRDIFKSHSAKNFISHFVQGLLIIAPLAITMFILYRIFDFIHTTFHFLGVIVHPLVDPFIIIAVLIFLIYAVGKLSSVLIFTPVYYRIQKDFEKVPFIRAVYSSIKDILSAFVGSKRKFNKPVLVTVDKANDIKQIGFLTQEDLSNMDIIKDYVAVYMPFSYGLSGKLLVVHKDNITPLNVSATDAMKFVVSGGVTHVD